MSSSLGEPCNYPTCLTKAVHVGYCGAHYKQRRLGETLRPVRGSAEYHQAKLNERGEKQCTKCGYWLALTEFYTRLDGSGMPLGRSHCNRCNILRRMSITARDYDEMLASQGGGCAICAAPDTGARRLDVDHDHACCVGGSSCGACVRGLLCGGCNAVLGRARDDVAILESAITYLTAVR